MDDIRNIIEKMERNPGDIRFTEVCKVCESFFGTPRQSGSHVIYKMPWRGDPRINLQDDNGKAKAYQVRQVLRAIYTLEKKNENTKK